MTEGVPQPGPVSLVSALLRDEATPRVLVVDDDRMTQMLLRRNLTQAGYEVDTASDGPSALERLRSSPDYDLIILDFVMPTMDGYEVLGQIVSDELLKSIPVVVVSGIDDRANAALLVEAGAADYLTKPVDGGLLRARAARCIEAKRARERERRLLSEVRAANEKLRELEQLRDRLTHMIVHDLRTPLTSLLGSLRLVASGKVPDPKPMIDLALETGSGLSDMINELLDIHRLESGTDFIEPAPADVAAVARAAVAKVKGFADTRAVYLKVEAANALPEVSFDKGKIERVLVNLVGNAVKVSPRGKEVRVLVDLRDGETRFEVVDEGPGIPEADRERIFERFYRVERPEANAVPSTGLGLAFCKLAVEVHGGRIWVDSRVGAGSRFIVSLPR